MMTFYSGTRIVRDEIINFYIRISISKTRSSNAILYVYLCELVFVHQNFYFWKVQHFEKSKRILLTFIEAGKIHYDLIFRIFVDLLENSNNLTCDLVWAFGVFKIETVCIYVYSANSFSRINEQLSYAYICTLQNAFTLVSTLHLWTGFVWNNRQCVSTQVKRLHGKMKIKVDLFFNISWAEY